MALLISTARPRMSDRDEGPSTRISRKMIRMAKSDAESVDILASYLSALASTALSENSDRNWLQTMS